MSHKKHFMANAHPSKIMSIYLASTFSLPRRVYSTLYIASWYSMEHDTESTNRRSSFACAWVSAKLTARNFYTPQHSSAIYAITFRLGRLTSAICPPSPPTFDITTTVPLLYCLSACLPAWLPAFYMPHQHFCAVRLKSSLCGACRWWRRWVGDGEFLAKSRAKGKWIVKNIAQRWENEMRPTTFRAT